MKNKIINKKILAYAFVLIMLLTAFSILGTALSHDTPPSTIPQPSPDTPSYSYNSAGSIKVGSSPFGLAFDSENDYVYVANDGSNSVSIISGTTVIANVSVGSTPECVVYDPVNHYIYVANYGSNSVSIISGTAVISTVSVGSYPVGVGFDSANNYTYVANSGSNSVSIISGTAVVSTVSVGSSPWRVAYDSGNKYIYISNQGSNSVSIISGTTLIANVSVGSSPWGIAYDSVNHYIYVSNSGSNSVSYFDEPPSVSINSSRATVDAGQSVSFTAAVSGVVGNYSYQWYVNGIAISGSNSSRYSTSFTSSGTDSVYVVITDEGYIATSNTITETVDPELSISISAIRNPSDSGQQVDFTTTVSGGSGTYTSYSYILYDGTSTSDSQLSSGSDPSFSYTFSSSGSYLLDYSVTDSNNYTVSSSIIQTVNSDPSVSITSSQNPVDTGIPVEFKPVISGGTLPASYKWEANGNTYTTKDINVTFTSPGGNIVTLTITDSNNYSASATFTETVNTNPTVEAYANVSETDTGIPVLFTSIPKNGTGPYNISWSENGVLVSYDENYTTSFSNSGTYTLEITVRDADNVTNSANVTVIVNPNPTVSITVSLNETDAGVPQTFKANITGGTGPYNYSWYDNNIEVSTNSSFIFNSSTPGSYNISLILEDKYDRIADSNIIDEIVEPDPVITVSYSHSPVVSESTTIYTHIKGGVGNFSLTWSFNIPVGNS